MADKDFAEDVIEELLDMLASGKPLSACCEEKRMPKRRTVYDWIENDADFAARFHAARARGVHALADECLEIADEKAKDAIEVADKRVRIDTRLRLAGKWLPSMYGDKVDLTSGGKPINEVDDTTRAIRIAAVLNAIGKGEDADHAG